MKLNGADLDLVFALGDRDGDGESGMEEFILIMGPEANDAVKRFRNCFKDSHDLVSGFLPVMVMALLHSGNWPRA